MSKTVGFFDKIKPHSRIKIEIVTKYFAAWVDVMKNRCNELTYLDLFSGPGNYFDGTPSTPMRVLSVAEKKGILGNLKAFFYENNPDFFAKLDESLKNHSAYKTMRTKPAVFPDEVNRDLVPKLPSDDCTFSFVDPHGYRDLSAELLTSLVKNWGSDCIFYLSTSGIRRNIESPTEEHSLKNLFGESGLKELRAKFKNEADWYVKDRLIIKKLTEVIQLGQKTRLYFIDFGMEFEASEMVSYYLILATKHHRAFAIMKDIMELSSVLDPDGIPLYLYSEIKLEKEKQLQLQFDDRMPNLKSILCDEFKNKTMKVKDVLESCHKLGYPYTNKNMREAMLLLEGKQLSVDIPQDKRQKRNGKPTLGPDREVTFNCY